MIKMTKSVEIAMYAACASVNEKGIWFVHGKMPVLFFYNFEKCATCFYRVIPGGKHQDIAMFLSMYETEDDIFLIPGNENKIIVYSKKQDSFQQLQLDNVCKCMFRGCYADEDFVYCIPYRYSRMVKINIHTKELVYCADWKMQFEKSDELYTNGYCIFQNRCLVVIPGTNSILIYDKYMDSWEKRDIGNGSENYVQISCSDRHIYLFETNTKSIIKTDATLRSCLKRKAIAFQAVKIERGYDSDLIIDDVDTDTWLVLDEELQEKYKTAYKKEQICESLKSDYHFGCWIKSSDDKLFCLDTENHLLIINSDYTFLEKMVGIEIKKWNEIEKINHMVNKVSIIQENNIYNLRDFLERLCKN